MIKGEGAMLLSDKEKLSFFLKDSIENNHRGKVRVLNKKYELDYNMGKAVGNYNCIDFPLCNVTDSGIELGVMNMFCDKGSLYFGIGIISFENIHLIKETGDDYPLIICDFNFEGEPFQSYKISGKSRVSRLGEELKSVKINSDNKVYREFIRKASS